MKRPLQKPLLLMEQRFRLWTMLVVLVVAGCGQIPTALPAHDPSPGVTQPGASLPRGPTELPYPMPTREPPPTRTPSPTPLPQPTPIVLGTEWAPLEEQETYVSTTVLVAPAGDGPGQVGIARMGDFPIGAESFAVDVSGNIYILDEINQRVVQFNTEGYFVRNTVYGDAVQAPAGLAVDAGGQIYIYDALLMNARIRLFDREGSLVRDYPIPSWLGQVSTMLVDLEGTLWVDSGSFYPGAPLIEGTPYGWVTVPLGNTMGLFNGNYQLNNAMPGHLCDSGKTLITYRLSARGPAYAYNRQGERIYEILEGLTCTDENGNLCGIASTAPGMGLIVWWNPQGKRIASVDYPGGATLVKADGTIYSFVVDWEEHVYRVTRLRPER